MHGDHAPIDDNATLQHFAMLFRHPEERLMSMYWWLRQKQLTCCGTDFGWEGGVWYNVVMAIARGMSPKKTLSPFGGCQLHMVMGHRCCSRHVYDKPMDDVVRAAKARIDQLFFVGITSEWFNSVCLFNYKMTGVRYVTALQLENCRPGGLAVLNKRWNSTLEKHLQFHLGNMTDYKGHSVLLRDELDHAVYAHAAARFQHELKAHRIGPATCPSASKLVRGTSCNADSGRLAFSTLRALNFTRLFPKVRRHHLASV